MGEEWGVSGAGAVGGGVGWDGAGRGWGRRYGWQGLVVGVGVEVRVVPWVARVAVRVVVGVGGRDASGAGVVGCVGGGEGAEWGEGWSWGGGGGVGCGGADGGGGGGEGKESGWVWRWWLET
nr:putative glycine-rich cell wall structural protein 1 [Arachis hypogaea]